MINGPWPVLTSFSEATAVGLALPGCITAEEYHVEGNEYTSPLVITVRSTPLPSKPWPSPPTLAYRRHAMCALTTPQPVGPTREADNGDNLLIHITNLRAE
jgi:hypothetical protein